MFLDRLLHQRFVGARIRVQMRTLECLVNVTTGVTPRLSRAGCRPPGCSAGG